MAQRPLVQVSPVQQAALTPQVPPAAAQLTVFGTHWPDTQRPEQQPPEDEQLSPSSRQPATPSPQTPDVQRPLQHWAGWVQAVPLTAQDPLAQRPPEQLRPAQHPPKAPPHSWPEPAQLGVISPHRPP